MVVVEHKDNNAEKALVITIMLIMVGTIYHLHLNKMLTMARVTNRVVIVKWKKN